MVKLIFCKEKYTIKIPDMYISSFLKTKSRHLLCGCQLSVHRSPTHPCLIKHTLTGISAAEIYSPAEALPSPWHHLWCGEWFGEDPVSHWNEWRAWQSFCNKQDMVILVRLRPPLLWFPGHTLRFPCWPSGHSWLRGLVHKHPGSGRKETVNVWACCFSVRSLRMEVLAQAHS